MIIKNTHLNMQDIQTQWWRLSPQQVLEKLETESTGLSSDEVKARLEIYGSNELPEEPQETWLLLFLRQFNSPLLFILMIAALLAFLLGEYIDGSVIVGVLLLNGVVGAFQEGKAKQSLRALKKYTQTQTVVLRDGVPTEVSSSGLVPGDIIELYPGDRIPADARLIESESLRVNEAALTGESLPVEKSLDVIDIKNVVTSDQHNRVFNGTFLVDGIAKAVVTTTGIHTVMGQISQKIADIETEIPLQKNIASLSKIVMISTIVVIIATAILGLVIGHEWKDMLLMTSSLLVSVIPEGLPIVMTLVLALGVNRMAKRNALVKKLQAVEGLAHTTVIGVDKTGTITRNELMVEQVFVDGNIYTVSGEGYIPKGEILYEGKPAVASHELGFDYATYLATLSANADLVEKEGVYTVTGDPTEGALLVLGEKSGYKKLDVLHESPVLYQTPFNTTDKYYISAHTIKDKSVMVIAGAPEVVIEHCSHMWRAEGATPLSTENKKTILLEMERMAKKSLRVVMLAVQTEGVSVSKDNVELKNLSFVSLFGMRDSMRAEVPDAVAKTKQAGMHVVMITGDHKITAQAIAAKAGIYNAGDRVLTGSEIDTMNDQQLIDALDDVSVFARVTPEHKSHIVEAYKKRGDIIAMTGDGVNDVPPLVAAHLGLAMGGIGTEVTKESADIVLLDDNFATITAAIEEGRHIFNTLKKVLVYLFSTNLGELLLIVLAMSLLLPVPLSPAQLIWINLVTDTFLVLALAFEPMEKNILSSPFKKPTKYIIDKSGFVRLVMFGVFIALGTLGVFYVYQANLDLARTMTLVTLGFFELFRLWSIRTDRESCFSENPLRSPWLLAGSVFVLLLQISVVHVSFMQATFATVPLSLRQWGIAAVFGVSVLVVDEIYKLVIRMLHRRQHLS